MKRPIVRGSECEDRAGNELTRRERAKSHVDAGRRSMDTMRLRTDSSNASGPAMASISFGAVVRMTHRARISPSDGDESHSVLPSYMTLSTCSLSRSSPFARTMLARAADDLLPSAEWIGPRCGAYEATSE